MMCRRLVVMLCLMVVLGRTSSAVGVLDPSLMGWWTFDEGAGTVAGDSSGQGRDGVLVSDPIWRPDGVRGGCLFFDGYEAHVRIANHESLNPGDGSFTILFWANVETAPGTRGGTNWDLAVNKRDSGSVGYYVGADRNQGPADRTGFRFMSGDSGANRKDTPYVQVPLGEWVFVAAVLDRAADAQKISLDGGQTWATTAPPPGPITPGRDLGIGWDIGENNYWFHGRIDDVAIFSRALSDPEIKLIMDEGMTPELAKDPQPQDGAVDVPREVVLRWEPGLYAATHDVYFGANPADVEAADRGDPRDVLVGQGQTALTFDVGRLAFGQTYHWRVDEVNAPPDSTVFTGDLWSFTVEPVGYPLAAEHITATASSSSSDDERPENTVGGIGLDAQGRHSIDTTEMWLSGAVGPDESAWIQYEFDKIYALHQIEVWNHNAMTEPLIGFGIKDAKIEYSLDGIDWTSLGEEYTFAQGLGKADYASNTTIDCGAVAAAYVRITALSNWGGLLAQYGLSEIRFLHIPMRARQPEPPSGAVDVVPELTLHWRTGREAAVHEVYLSADVQAVIDRTAPVTVVSETALDTGMLDLGQTYFWRVDEVNEAEATHLWGGNLWSFSTPEYIVVEDFEGYNDTNNLIYDAWIDGWENDTGAQVGYLDAPFAEHTIVRSGSQSMPLIYSNTNLPFYSEAERFFDVAQDWTVHGIRFLTLHFRGAIGNDGQLYIKINDTKVVYDGDAVDIAKAIWHTWDIDLSAVGADMRNVRRLTIGVEGSGTKGTLYVDDILLYAEPPQRITPTEPDHAHLVAYFAFEGDAADGSGNNHHGEAVDNPVYVAGVRGQAIQFDGSESHVRIAHHDSLNPLDGHFSITLWAYLEPSAGSRGTTNWDLAVAKRDTGSMGYYVGADRGQSGAGQAGYKFMLGNTSGQRVDTPFVAVSLDEWVYVAAVLDRDQNVHKISVDGGQTWATGTPPSGRIEPTEDLGIGWDIGEDNYWFHGKVDEVRIYNQALSDEEVAWLAGH